MTVYVDTLKLATRLEAGGFTADQAKTVASVLGEAAETADLATKADIEPLATKPDLQNFRTEVRTEFAGQKAEISGIKTDVAALRAELHSEIKLLDQRMTIRLGGMLVVLAGVLLTAIRTMH